MPIQQKATPSQVKGAHKRFFRPHLVDDNLEWKSVVERGKQRTLQPGEAYCPKNNDLVFVEKGFLQFLSTSDVGEKKLVYNVGRNSIANASATATGCNRYITLHCKKECSIVCFDAYKVYDYKFIQDNPRLLIDLAKSMAKTSTMFSFRAYNMYFHASLARICRILVTLTAIESDPEYQRMDTMTQNDIGIFAGAHHVTVSRALEKLRSEGIIGEVTPSYVEIFDYDRLYGLQDSVD